MLQHVSTDALCRLGSCPPPHIHFNRNPTRTPSPNPKPNPSPNSTPNPLQLFEAAKQLGKQPDSALVVLLELHVSAGERSVAQRGLPACLAPAPAPTPSPAVGSPCFVWLGLAAAALPALLRNRAPPHLTHHPNPAPRLPLQALSSATCSGRGAPPCTAPCFPTSWPSCGPAWSSTTSCRPCRLRSRSEWRRSATWTLPPHPACSSGAASRREGSRQTGQRCMPTTCPGRRGWR